MGIRSPRPDPPDALVQKWSAMHEAAATVGAIAGVEREHVADALERGSSALSRAAGDPLLAQEVQDLAEVLQRGVSALLTAHTSGGAPHAAAGTLWLEFVASRDALLARHAARTIAPPR